MSPSIFRTALRLRKADLNAAAEAGAARAAEARLQAVTELSPEELERVGGGVLVVASPTLPLPPPIRVGIPPATSLLV